MMLNILINGFVPLTDKFSYEEKENCYPATKTQYPYICYHISYL